jgi:hypothetical protein
MLWESLETWKRESIKARNNNWNAFYQQKQHKTSCSLHYCGPLIV